MKNSPLSLSFLQSSTALWSAYVTYAFTEKYSIDARICLSAIAAFSTYSVLKYIEDETIPRTPKSPRKNNFPGSALPSTFSSLNDQSEEDFSRATSMGQGSPHPSPSPICSNNM